MHRIDIAGQRFNKLKVIGFAYTRNGKAFWKCLCDCGKEIEVESYPLRHNLITSCGCLKNNGLEKGYSHEPLYDLWWSMKRRCSDASMPSYKNYGAKGITVCEEWLDYSAFYKWATHNGYKRGLTIDRINPDGNYEPKNCRWIDWKTQERNRKNNRLLTLGKETRCMAEWAEILGISPKTIKSRLRSGWSVERTLTEHIHSKNERRKG